MSPESRERFENRHLAMVAEHGDPLREQAIELLLGQSRKQSRQINHGHHDGKRSAGPPLELSNDGNYMVKKGDTLSGIAVRELAREGLFRPDSRAIGDEVSRIVSINAAEHPELSHNASLIRVGISLKIWDKETGPDTTCRWKEWKEAAAFQVTFINKCERALAGKDSLVVVQPGAAAVLNPGSYAFVAPNGIIQKSLPGSVVLTADGGTTQARIGASLRQIGVTQGEMFRAEER